MNPVDGDLCSVRWNGNLLLDEPHQWSHTVKFEYVHDREIALVVCRKGSFCQVVLTDNRVGWIAWDYLRVLKRPINKSEMRRLRVTCQFL